MIKYINSLRQNLAFYSPSVKGKKSSVIFFLLVLFIIFINFQSRISEKNYWLENKDTFYIDEIPITRSGDPGYYLGTAIDIKKNKGWNEFESKRVFPTKIGNKELISTPMLSKFIAFLSIDSSLKEISNAANLLILITTILTPICILILFTFIGRPYEGIVASLATGISSQYGLRSSIGYVDTDILNLAFIYLLYASIYFASMRRQLAKAILLVIIAGCIAKLFYAWYPKKELIVLSSMSLAFLTFMNFDKFRDVIILNSIYILVCGIDIFLRVPFQILSSPYFGFQKFQENPSSFNYENGFRFIGELQKPSIQTLLNLEFNIFISIFCIIGLILWGITYPKKFIGLAPLTAFILTSEILGQRAFMYWAPFFFFGGAYLTNFILIKISDNYTLAFKQFNIFLISTVCLLAFIIYEKKPFSPKLSMTLITVDTLRAFFELGKLVKDEDRDNSVIVTPWSYGYQSILFSELPSILDGGEPTSPRHYFLNKALLSTNQEETSKILKYMAAGNVEKHANEIETFQELAKKIYETEDPNVDIYIVLTNQMRLWLQEMSSIAFYDIENDMPIEFDGNRASDAFSLQNILCDSIDPKTLITNCSWETTEDEDNQIEINLNLGLVEGEPRLKRVVQVDNGKVTLNNEYPNSNGNLVFQIINLPTKTNIYLTHEAVYKTTYNQLFHLNNNENYNLIYDQYPFVKVYKVN
jgi:dolichyl-diphosphooligosaccharide--protein glycosyltransferase